MFCKKCGTEIIEGSNKCLNCGFEIAPSVQNFQLTSASQTELNEPVTNTFDLKATKNDWAQTPDSTTSKKLSVWNWMSIASLICGLFTFYKGINRMVKYDNGEYYPYETVNAYVGGDAYNYIINGTHATAFFVLTAMFVLAAIGLLIVHYLANGKKEA